MKKEKLDKISFNLITVRSHEQVAHAIKRIRNLYGYSQVDLAKKTGLTQATVSRAENKSRKVEIGTLILILSALNADLVIAPRVKNSNSSLEGLF
ncbi:MAG: helix-turn-helix transcriptional regulator [Bdellovibrionota bacterium]